MGYPKFGLGSNPSNTMHSMHWLNLDLLKKALTIKKKTTIDYTSNWFPIGKIQNDLEQTQVKAGKSTGRFCTSRVKEDRWSANKFEA